MRLSATKNGAISTGRGLGNELWDKAGTAPSLDLPFADNKSLVDATTGSNLVTFTRASSGTFVGSDGVLRTAVTNLLLRSEEFGVSPWSLGGAATVTANSTVAPNGQATADTVNTNAAGIDVTSGSATITASATVTASIYVKTGGTVLFVRIQVWDNSANGFRVWVNNSTGAVGTSAAIGTGTFATASSTSIGGGWFRIALTGTCGTSTSPAIAMAGADADGSFVRTAGQTYIVWGAQLEQSSTVGEYVPTGATINSAPRFDHNPVTGESLGLLVEEQRTNLLLRSEEFDNASWVSGGIVTANTVLAPNGTTSADTVTVANTGTPNLYQDLACTASTQYTFSFYVRLGTLPSSDYGFSVRDNTGAAFIGSTVVPTGLSSSAWVRVSHTFTTPVGCVSLRVYPYRQSAVTGGTIYLWGAQLEAGAFPTSYIPTTTAAATRSADVASITGSAFSGWYRQDEGTLFIEGVTQPVLSRFPTEWSIHDGTDFNKIEAYNFTSLYGATVRKTGEANTDPAILVSPVSGVAYKKAVAIRAGDYRIAVQGQQGAAANPAFMPTVNEIRIGATRLGAATHNSTIRRLTYWPQRLSNASLQTLTQ